MPLPLERDALGLPRRARVARDDGPASLATAIMLRLILTRGTIDGDALAPALLAEKRGERRVCAMVRVSTPEKEDRWRIPLLEIMTTVFGFFTSYGPALGPEMMPERAGERFRPTSKVVLADATMTLGVALSGTFIVLEVVLVWMR